MRLQETAGGEAKSGLKTPEAATNHPVGDKKGLIIGRLSRQVIYQRGAAATERRHFDARTLTWTVL